MYGLVVNLFLTYSLSNKTGSGDLKYRNIRSEAVCVDSFGSVVLTHTATPNESSNHGPLLSECFLPCRVLQYDIIRWRGKSLCVIGAGAGDHGDVTGIIQ